MARDCKPPILTISLLAVLGLGACKGPQTFDESQREREREESAAFPPLRSSDYSVAVTCGRQGSVPNAKGTLTNKTNRKVGFEIWVAFKTPDGKTVDYSNTFTDKNLEGGETGSWDTFPSSSFQSVVTACEVACVDQLNPFKSHVRENCQRYADAG